MPRKKTQSTLPNPPISLAKAFQAVEHEIKAVPDESLVRITVDVPYAVQIAFGAAEHIRLLLPELETLPKLDIRKVRILSTYAGAALHAYLRAQEPDTATPQLQRIIQQAVSLRATLLTSADPLVHVGLLPAEHVAAIRKGRGHADTASDLSALASLYESHWDQLEGKTIVTRAMVRRAAALGPRMHAELGARRISNRPNEPIQTRRRIQAQAFTLFVGVYDICLRGVTYLRWEEGDVERFVPSLYPRRGPRSTSKAKASSSSAPEPSTEPSTEEEDTDAAA